MASRVEGHVLFHNCRNAGVSPLHVRFSDTIYDENDLPKAQRLAGIALLAYSVSSRF